MMVMNRVELIIVLEIILKALKNNQVIEGEIKFQSVTDNEVLAEISNIKFLKDLFLLE